MKKFYIIAAGVSLPFLAHAQGAIDAYRIAQPDLKGTARFMSMGGAFGALGGDISTISHNPAGIGIYRSNEVSLTFNLDAQSAISETDLSSKWNSTHFTVNNVGAIGTIKLNSEAVPNVNIGFSYNRAVSFNRKYRGGFGTINNSLSSYIAGIANGEGLSVADVAPSKDFDPYNPTDGGIAASWLAILGYEAFLITPEGTPDKPQWYGLWDRGTSGSANFSVSEKGHVDEYNIALGGNVRNILYWGMNFDIMSLDYTMNAIYGENLNNAYVDNGKGYDITTANWDLRNYYNAHGTGFKYQLGLILKPIQEFRVGFAIHTPTWFNISETTSANVNFKYGNEGVQRRQTNKGVPAYNDVNLRTPWTIMVSAAGVIGGKCVISGDYEWAAYDKMKFSVPGNNYFNYGYDDGWYDDDIPWFAPGKSPKSYSDDYNNPFYATNQDIKEIFRSTHTLRLGAEYRITPSFSLRAGYSLVTSPVTAKAKEDKMEIYTAGTLPNYRLSNNTDYITCGLGYRVGGFSVDAAYVHKHNSSTYHAYTSDPTSGYHAPQAKLSFNSDQVLLTFGFKF